MSVSMMVRLRMPADVRRSFKRSAAVLARSGRGVLAQLARELGRHVGLDLDPALAVTGRVERAALAHALHERAHALCFIASSVNFPVTHEAEVREASSPAAAGAAAGD